MFTSNKLIVTCIVGAIIILAIIIIIVICVNKSKKKNKEGFFTTTQGAYIDPVTGVMKGVNLMTDGMTRLPIDSLKQQIQQSGVSADGKQTLGIVQGNGFDQLYSNQQDINEIDKRATNGMHDYNSLTEINSKIASSANNAANNLYTRGGSIPVKMKIVKGEARGIIDAKYLPERDKNYRIDTVDVVIDVPGFDVNIERMGEYLADTHFSGISNNKKQKRIPTSAGATGGGGGRFNNKMIDTLENTASATIDAVNDNIKIIGNQLAIAKGTEPGDQEFVTTNLDTSMNGSINTNKEGFHTKYISGGHTKIFK